MTTDYATRALEAITRIPSANNPPHLLERLVEATAAIGATASLYTAAIPEGGDEQSCFSLFACDPAYAHAQLGLGPLLAHPWFRFARTHMTPGTERSIRIEDRMDAAAIELARRYGFRSCFIVPTPAGGNIDRLEMLCLGSSHENDFQGAEVRVVRALARSLAAELHDWLTHYLRNRLLEASHLESTDVELLAMEWRGLGTKQIAARTGMSLTCIDTRFKRINKRLRCSGRKASATRAAAHGLLDSR